MQPSPQRVQLHARPWQGLFSLASMIEELSRMLPATFEDLPKPLAVGVMTEDGGHRLLSSGPLPQAVAASCAIPWMFAPVSIAGEAFADGAWVDRTALQPWRGWRPGRTAVVHIVESSGERDPDPQDQPFFRSPRSGASIFGHGDVRARFEQTRAAARSRLGELKL